jgi:2-isopropylmalate synthase
MAAGIDVHVADYREQAMRSGEDATAVAYVEIESGERNRFGVGRHPNIVTASFAAIVSALNGAGVEPRALPANV